MLGSIIIWIAFAASLISAYSYYLAFQGKTAFVQRARTTFIIMVAGVVSASVLLMLYILRHQFEYEYIWSYSSRDLPLELLVTTFWAGQEGSFLFWAFCSVLIGLFLLNYTKKRGIEHETMFVYILLNAFLLLLMILKSPFEFVWDAFPKEVQVGQVPADGRGLNPLLQNFWMIIHPPILFIGFAAMGVLYAFAVGALWKRSYKDWIQNALPWVLFGAFSLGAGLMLGGYWAYGVLGWGGWWGWDPVENSSLVPWIIGVALLHTMVVQKKTGKLARTNFALAILTFVFVVYSTFLTRSGILSEASVHSFVDPGTVVYTFLVIWIATIIGFGFYMLSKRWNELKALGAGLGSITRESLLTIGVLALSASALIILFGTSLPIVSKTTVEPSFYDKTNLPIAVIMGLLIGLSLLVQYRMESGSGLFKRSLNPLIIATVLLAVLVIIGLRDVLMAVLAFSALFALVISVRHGYRIGKDQPMLIGGSLSHIGIAMLFLSIIGSGFYGQKVTVTLPKNEKKEVLGYDLTYIGARPNAEGKWNLFVEVEKGSSVFTLSPIMYQSDYNNSVMRIPDYNSFLTRDFYIEPVQVEEGDDGTHAHDVYDLSKGETISIDDMKVTFVRFEMNQHGKDGMMASGEFAIGAILEVQRGKVKEQVTLVTIFKGEGERITKPTLLKDGVRGFEFMDMSVGMEGKASTVRIKALGLTHDHEHEEKPETLVIEASLKPFMVFVWLATLFVLVGFLLAMIHRNRDIRESANTVSIKN